MANFVNAEDVRWFEQYILFKSMFNKTDVHVGRGDKAKNATRRRSRSRSPIAVIHDHARSTEGAGMEGVRLPQEQAARQRVGGATSHANLAARQRAGDATSHMNLAARQRAGGATSHMNLAARQRAGGATSHMNLAARQRAGGATSHMNLATRQRAGGATSHMNLAARQRAGGATSHMNLAARQRAGGATSHAIRAARHQVSMVGKIGRHDAEGSARAQQNSGKLGTRSYAEALINGKPKENGGKSQNTVQSHDRQVAKAEREVDYRCPIKWCGQVVGDRLKGHMYRFHIPTCFDPRRTVQYDRDVVKDRSWAVKELTKLAGFKDVWEAIGEVNKQGTLHKGSFSPAQVIAITELALHKGWRVPNRFKLTPVNCPAVLLHWEVAAVLLSTMSRDAAQRFMHINRNRDTSLRTRSRKGEERVQKGHKKAERPVEGRTTTVPRTDKEAQGNKIMDYQESAKMEGKNMATERDIPVTKESAPAMEVDRVQQKGAEQVNADDLLSEDTPHLNWAEETANLEEELLLELTISE